MGSRKTWRAWWTSQPRRDWRQSGKKATRIVKQDNILFDNKPEKPVASDYGTSADAGLRRLDKAAQAGNAKAADMLRRVTDPNDAMTVHNACVVMGWRKPTKTIPDTEDALVEAVIRKLGHVDTVRQVWDRANTEDCATILAWINNQP